MNEDIWAGVAIGIIALIILIGLGSMLYGSGKATADREAFKISNYDCKLIVKRR